MNARQRIFAAEYIKNGRIGVAAVYAAGYSQGYNAACVTASRLLRNAKVKSMIDHVEQKAITAAELTEERVKKEIASMAFAEVKEVDLAAKMKGLDLATKVLGMQVQKVETSTDQSDTKLHLSAEISALSEEMHKSEREIEYDLQVRFANRSRKSYDPALDPTVHPEIWKSGNLLITKEIEAESDSVS